MNDWQIERDKLAAMLQDIIETMELSGTFRVLSFADDETGLPFVWHKLRVARDIAVSQASPGVVQEPANYQLQ